MPKPSFPGTTAAAAEAWAEVRAHDRVIRYRRSGLGRSVLLVLGGPADREPLWPELLDRLDAGFRVLVPEPPPLDADVASWLADFLEGLGTSNVRILAADRFCVPVLELAFFGLDQIAGIVLVPDGGGAEGEPRGAGLGALDSALRQAAVPLLVVRRGRPAGEIVPVVTDFLRGTAAAPA